jgi:hypothetical protein
VSSTLARALCSVECEPILTNCSGSQLHGSPVALHPCRVEAGCRVAVLRGSCRSAGVCKMNIQKRLDELEVSARGSPTTFLPAVQALRVAVKSIAANPMIQQNYEALKNIYAILDVDET